MKKTTEKKIKLLLIAVSGAEGFSDDILNKERFELTEKDTVEEAASFFTEGDTDLVIVSLLKVPGKYKMITDSLNEHNIPGDIPILFLLGKYNPEIIEDIHSNYCGDYAVLPDKQSDLVNRIKNLAKLKRFAYDYEEIKTRIKKLHEERDEFLSITAHDLKNPIYSISMLGKVLRDEELEKNEMREFSQDIITISERMLELISNLLDINAIEQGKIKLNFEEFDLKELTVQTIELYRERAQKKKIRLGFRSDDNTMIYADRSAALQILDNLISNAVKYSPNDKNIYVRLIEKDEYIRIEVEDEGQGLTEDDKEKLFGKFAKLSARPTGDESSSGLGLSIVKRYVDSMNGRVWCESEYGHGANFIVELPKAGYNGISDQN